MATTSPHQLFLIADHLKLSLLERQRAVSLKLDSTKQDHTISRSLATLQQGITSLEAAASPSDQSNPNSDLSRLKKQYAELSSQFPTTTDPTTNPSLTSPNDPSLSSTFTAAQSQPRKKPNRNVRFHDNPSETPYTDNDAQEITDPIEAANRAALFNNKPYTDAEDASRYRDEVEAEGMDNQQILTYQNQVIAEQDSQLDVLGQSVRRQRLLGMQMGEEMEEQNEMLGDVERGVDRHTTTLERARKRLGDVARKSKGNWSWITIGILIVILLLVIIVLK